LSGKQKIKNILDQNVEAYARRTLFFANANDSVITAAKVMQENGVESVIVRENDAPVGILTIKDLIFRVISKGLDPEKVTVSSVMSSPLITIKTSDTLKTALNIMKRNNIRRILVLDKDGKPYGLIVLKRLAGDIINKYTQFEEKPISWPQDYIREVTDYELQHHSHD